MESKKLLQTRATKASHLDKPAHETETNSEHHDSHAHTYENAHSDNHSSHTIVSNETTRLIGEKDHNQMPSQVKKAFGASPARYSQLEEDKPDNRQRIMRVGLFALVIVVLAVGAILFIENGSRQTSNGNQATQSTTSQNIAQIAGFELSRTVQTDDNAGIIPARADFNVSRVSLGSSANTQDTAVISNLQYNVYSSATRFVWELEGVTTGLPASTIEYDAATNTILVTFVDVDVADSQMITTVTPSIGSNEEIAVSQNANSIVYSLKFDEAVRYAPVVNAANATLTLFVRTETQITNSISSAASTTTASQTSTTTTAATTTSQAATSTTATNSTTSQAAVGQVLQNAYSRNPQTISSGLTNTVAMRSFFYQDFGPHFEFSWVFGPAGVSSVPPKATAQFIVEDNINYIEVKIEGVTEDYFQARGQSQATFGNINTTYANIVKVIFRGRENNVSTYWVQVKGLSDFRLMATGERNGNQKLTLDIRD